MKDTRNVMYAFFSLLISTFTYSLQQCTRLGHTCDYRPRLAFRDDTPRIMGRMADVKTNGHVVWDRKHLLFGRFSSSFSTN
jgi:hypothetical protein